MLIRQRIERKLTEGLAPSHLAVIDESNRHAGHAGADPHGETHFHVDIVADAFRGQSRVARQRAVYALLAEEIRDGVHALSMTTKTPEETKIQ